MRFIRELKSRGAWLLMALMLLVSLRYLNEPERQMFGAPMTQWGSGLVNVIIGSAADAQLQAQTQTLAYGRPLIEYDGLSFLGCDLALNKGQTELVTYWDGLRLDGHSNAQLRLHLLSTNGVIEYSQPVTASTLYWPLPKDYYSEMQRGDVWLRLIEASTNASLKPLSAVFQTPYADWFQICAS